MNDLLDRLSYIGKISTDLLFVKNPLATSMGFFFGVLVHGLVGAGSSFLEFFGKIADSPVNVFHYVAGGIFLFNAKSFLAKDEVPQQVISAIDFIQNEVAAGRLTKIEAKQKYRILIEKYIESVTLDTETASRVREITDTLQK